MFSYLEKMSGLVSVFAAVGYLVYPSDTSLGFCMLFIALDLLIINKKVKNSCWY
jgi:hypothetical protein